MSKVINTEINKPFELQAAFQRGYEQGREDAIDDFKSEMKAMKSKAYQFLNTDYASGYISALSTLEGYAEQMKGTEE